MCAIVYNDDQQLIMIMIIKLVRQEQRLARQRKRPLNNPKT